MHSSLESSPHFDQKKNHDLFLKSAQILSQTSPSAHFMIAGDGPERKRLQALADDLRLKQRVHFLGSTQDIPGVLSAFDICALTSHNEASPVSIMEALSCERPVVATNVGSIDESVIEGQTGFLVPAGDALQTADRWQRLINQPELRARLGRQGRDHVIKNSSLESMTNGYMQLVETLFYKKHELPIASDMGNTSWREQMPTTNQLS